MDEIRNKISEIVLENASIYNECVFHKDLNLLEDLGFDSIQFVNVIVSLETEFPDDLLLMDKIKTVNDLYSAIKTILIDKTTINE